MVGLAAIACSEGYTICKLDIKGASIQMEMMGTPVYIKCSGELKQLIVDMFPGLKSTLDWMVYSIITLKRRCMGVHWVLISVT
jgi:hypothetical protein